MNVKLNDNVLVISGKYAGKTGKVIATSPKHGTVTVEGVNVHKKAQKARRANEVSKIAEIEAPLDVSNVMVVCGSCDKAVRVKHAVIDGKKVRVCPKCGASLEVAAAGKASKKTAKKTEEAPAKRVRKRAKKEETAETAPQTDDKAE
ncbi:MAG: 50S ribosomal protein L24 [Clostridia bacterium]|nr:50S ribosomal protein L24 [Clostridia bacterium]